MAYTFAADQDKLESLANSLAKSFSESVTREIGSVYNEIGNLSDSWDGESYQQFATGCNAYKGALETIPTVLGCFATTFNNAAGGVAELENNIKTALSELSS